MEKNKFSFKDGLVARNDRVVLKVLCEADRDNYFELSSEKTIMMNVASMMNDVDYKAFVDYIWEEKLDKDTLYASVFLNPDAIFVGIITLQNLSSSIPEIGIDILKKYRRQGIASEVIPLFAKRMLELNPVEYFIVKIYSDNNPSRSLFEKLGAVRIGEEPTEFEELLAHMKKVDPEEYKQFLANNPNAEKIAAAKSILQFRYLPV